MWLALRKQDMNRIRDELGNVKLLWIFVSAGLAALSQFSRAYRWKMQLHAANAGGTY